MDKRGQPKGSGAAMLVGIITLIIIFYILFLPPQERSELLGEKTTTTTTTTEEKITKEEKLEPETVLLENPGRIDIIKDVEDKDIPNIYLFEATQAKELSKFNPIYIKNGVFDKRPKEITLNIEDLENTDNILLSFTAPKRIGILSIDLNGKNIYEYAITTINPDPIEIDKETLKQENQITFSVNDVGWKFWRTNEYSLENIKVIGDVSDVSRQKSRNIFTLSQSEYFTVDESNLKFIPYCSGVKDIGKLQILINNEEVFDAVPICDDPYKIPFSTSTLRSGENTIVFKTNKGSYSVEQIRVDIEAEETKGVTYYFDMNSQYFLQELEEKRHKCGEVDNVCPDDCDEDRDKDCCLDETNNYWCDIETDDIDDRCASAITQEKCARCPSGYEDKDGKPDEDCEDLCGDDKDDTCPEGCPKNYDKDCCFEEDSDNYWCDDVPVTGIDSVCEASLTSGECKDCPKKYKTETGSDVKCEITDDDDEKTGKLKSSYTATLKIDFVDDNERKRGTLNVNGRLTFIDQYDPEFEINIDDWVEENNNYIRIEPKTSLSIVNLEVKVE